MKIIDRYIATTLVVMTAIALCALLVFFAFLSLVDQLEETGQGSYDALAAARYVMLTLPRLAYEAMPVAAVVGSITTLGLMAYNSELVVIRTSGISSFRLAYSLTKGAVVIIVFTILLGEFVAPYCEQAAQQLRSVAISEQISLKTKNGFWSRDGKSYINIRKLLPGDRLEDIYIYEFDDDDRLRVTTYAKSAAYREGQWILENIQQSLLEENRISSRRLELAAWDSFLNPKVINLVTIQPQYLTVPGLVNYIDYLEKNQQNSHEYELALWSKLISPVTILVMVLIAVPLVKNLSRTVSVGQRIFVGSTIGIVFYIFNQLSGQMGMVYSINSFISAVLPTFITGLIVMYLIYHEA